MDTSTVKSETEALETPRNNEQYAKNAAASEPPSNSKDSELNSDSAKRRCVSTACIACRRRKSKCDGGLPACAACSSVYRTRCEYDPNSDHRRKGVYKKDTQNVKTRHSTLQTLIHAILNYPEEELMDLVHSIRTCESLDKVAEFVVARDNGEDVNLLDWSLDRDSPSNGRISSFESQLSGKMGELIVDDGSVRFIGGTSNLLFDPIETIKVHKTSLPTSTYVTRSKHGNPITSWTTVTSDAGLITHLLDLYFSWHYSFFTILSKASFYRDFYHGKPSITNGRKTEYCTPLLVNAMLAVACHFSSLPAACEIPEDSTTAGNHFFKEAKRLMIDGGEFELPSLASAQALALMSVREAGCNRESKGWIYSGMAFRMCCDLGLGFWSPGLASTKNASPDEEEEDVRRVTYWGCFLVDKCWSNYLGRIPTLRSPTASKVNKIEVLPDEDSEAWKPISDSGISRATHEPSRTRAVALRISALAEISGDLVSYFYLPHSPETAPSRQTELNRLSEIHTRLEKWKRDLPKEMEARDGQLPSVLVMHMFFQLLYIHLFRPFLKYNRTTSPLPSSVSPRKNCTQAALAISKVLRLYKRTHGLRRIVNIAVYIAHSACTIHLLNLPDKIAQRDITHGVKNIEEMAEGWLCAKKTLRIISSQAKNWRIELPYEAAEILARADKEFTSLNSSASKSPTPEGSYKPQDAVLMVGEGQNRSQTYGSNHVGDEFTPLTPGQVGLEASSLAFSSGIVEADAQQMNLLSTYQNELNRSQSPKSLARMPPSVDDSDNALDQQGEAINQNVLTQAGLAYQSDSPQLPQSIGGGSASSNPIGLKRPFIATSDRAEMFGGVEALLRDGHEWWIKDQSQLAKGFGNWGYNDTSQQVSQLQSQPQSQSQTQAQVQAQQLIGTNLISENSGRNQTQVDWDMTDNVQNQPFDTVSGAQYDAHEPQEDVLSANMRQSSHVFPSDEITSQLSEDLNDFEARTWYE